MRNRVTRIAALLFVPAAGAVIAYAPIGADTVHVLAGCATNQFPENVVRTSNNEGDMHAACTPDFSQPQSPQVSSQTGEQLQ